MDVERAKGKCHMVGRPRQGSGTVTVESSPLFTAAGVTWASRTEGSEGLTSSEALIAAAHAARFCMASSNELSSRDQEPARLVMFAASTFDSGRITGTVLDVEADIPGFATFREALVAAEDSCPVSNALRSNVDIQVTARSA